MLEVTLSYTDENGSAEIFVEQDKVSFGRGSDVDYRFDDEGLSRLHASIYREEDNIWIVDENSSNGTFVNGERVGAGGTPLYDGNTIKIGNHTKLKVAVGRKPAAKEEKTERQFAGAQTAAGSNQPKSTLLIPLLLTTFALFVIGGSIVFIGVGAYVGSTGNTTQTGDYGEDDDFVYSRNRGGVDKTINSNNASNIASDSNNSASSNRNDTVDTTENLDVIDTNSPIGKTGGEETTVNLPAGKTYQNMSEPEKNQYVKVKAEKIARIIGNNSGEAIPPEAVLQIRKWLDGYVRRIRSTRKNDCSMGGWISSDTISIMERARQNAPFIIKEFNRRDIAPHVGLYLAFIESEHCPCLQSPTGPLGLFQFTQATGRRHGLSVRSGANPSNPDERCKEEAAAKAAASYMKSLTARIGTGPLSVPLAIASYNSGEGGLGKNLKTALTANESQERSFWTLVSSADRLAEQFQKENIKYVPKFFGAAIIGENPRDFGINLLPLSSYTKS